MTLDGISLRVLEVCFCIRREWCSSSCIFHNSEPLGSASTHREVLVVWDRWLSFSFLKLSFSGPEGFSPQRCQLRETCEPVSGNRRAYSIRDVSCSFSVVSSTSLLARSLLLHTDSFVRRSLFRRLWLAGSLIAGSFSELPLTCCVSTPARSHPRATPSHHCSHPFVSILRVSTNRYIPTHRMVFPSDTTEGESSTTLAQRQVPSLWVQVEQCHSLP